MWSISKPLIILCLFFQQNKAADYAIVGDNMSFFQVCDSADSVGNTNASDLIELKLTHDYAEDMETVITNGKITALVDIPKDERIELNVEIFIWKRGKWENTVFSMRRTDFCASALDPTEIWYPLIDQIPKESRVCPPKKGTVYNIKDVSNRIELFDIGKNTIADFSGKYKGIIHFIFGPYVTCISTVVNVWRI